jgi:uncharacterized membrane protein (DUF485 family)
MKETIRRIRKRKTWVDPMGWEMAKGKGLILTVSFYLFALLTALRGEIKISIALLVVAIILTVIYVKIERQLKKDSKTLKTNLEQRQE